MTESTAAPDVPIVRKPRNPYVGPRPFRSKEHLFGREHEAKNLVNTLLSGRVVLLHSPSGAGKTSLIQTSVVPAFEERDFQICASSTRGFSALRVNLPPPPDLAVANRYVFSIVNAMVGNLVDRSEAAQMRIAAACELLGAQADRERQLLVIDQLEEILTLQPGDIGGQKEFFQQLGEALDHDRRWGLLAMREDYMGGLDRFRRYLPGQLRSTFRLDFLEERPAMVAVKQPAASVGVDFTDDAVALLVSELRHVKADSPDVLTSVVVSPYVEPVLLQVVCDSLWRKLAADQGAEFRTITREDVEDFRPFNMALSEFYRRVVREASKRDPDRERKIREWIDHHLISSQGLRHPTRSKPEVDDPDTVLRTLQHRYLVRDDPRPGGTWYELSHDLLVAPIREDNRTWRKDNLAAWQVMADKWHRFDHDRRFLLGPADLRTAIQLSKKTEITDTERHFLAESRSAVAAEGRLAGLKQLNGVFMLALGVSILLNIVLIIQLLS